MLTIFERIHPFQNTESIYDFMRHWRNWKYVILIFSSNDTVSLDQNWIFTHCSLSYPHVLQAVTSNFVSLFINIVFILEFSIVLISKFNIVFVSDFNIVFISKFNIVFILEFNIIFVSSFNIIFISKFNIVFISDIDIVCILDINIIFISDFDDVFIGNATQFQELV